MYKWVPANFKLGVTLRWTSIPSRKEQKYSETLHLMETGDKRWPDEPLGLYTNLTDLPTCHAEVKVLLFSVVGEIVSAVSTNLLEG